MGFLAPTPTPYDPLAWAQKPFAERARMVCEAWAMQGYGTPLAVYLVYALKVIAYIAGWMAFCRFTPGLGHLDDIAAWWLHPVAFQKAIVYSLLFEVLGFGCGSGPLTGRYFPPVGGFLYFLRPGTTKLPLFEDAPVIGNRTRGPLDVLLYAALVASCLRALVAEAPAAGHLVPIAVVLPLAGVLDRTIFLAARSEHFLTTIVCFIATPDWVPGAMAVQLALWFWAGVSKLNHHFPTVVCVMNSNSPFTRFAWLRRLMYRSYPDDLRPSSLATFMAHAGTALEVGVPLAFLLTPQGTPPAIAIVLMLLLHGYITSNVPMGVPIEWNVIVVYGGFALFWAHPEASLTALDPALAAFLIAALVITPTVGNFLPARVSFLLSMRYYAGNWASSVWLFKKGSHKKLERLTTSSAWVYDQLARFYDEPTAVGLVGKVMAFRLMHLHGRSLGHLLPKAVDDLSAYDWLDGEIIAGLALGWNFGEGHLHHQQLIANLQAQCGFEEGELRCILLESQPLFGSGLAYRVLDAQKGELASGEVSIATLREGQPWSEGDAG